MKEFVEIQAAWQPRIGCGGRLMVKKFISDNSGEFVPIPGIREHKLLLFKFLDFITFFTLSILHGGCTFFSYRLS